MTQWEPREALLAGPDGLDAFRALLAGVRSSAFVRHAGTKRLHAVGALALEVGEGQARGGRRAAARRPASRAIETRRDLAGIERVVVGER